MNPTQSLRAELLLALSQLSQLRPEWRFGQTRANLAMTAGRADAGGVWELEDEEALAAARTLIEEYSAALLRPERSDCLQRMAAAKRLAPSR